jgi:gliding motility-associated-like protein
MLEWATYYGGAVDEWLVKMSIDPATNDIYAAGNSNSTTLATAGVYQSAIAGGYDAVLVKFNENGMRQWCTYFGGANTDGAHGVAFDLSGGVSIIGRSNSTAGISTVGAYETTYPGTGGEWATFIARFNNTNGTRLWSTYYGVNALLWGQTLLEHNPPAIAVSPNAIYVTSSSYADPLIPAGTPLQGTCAGLSDITIAKFGFNGTIVWGTYYGTTNVEYGLSICVDGSENVYVGGKALQNGLATPGSFKQSFGGDIDALLLKLNSNGVRQWATYYGSAGADYVNGVAYAPIVDLVYIGGPTTSTDSIASTGASIPSKPGSSYSGYLACFNTSGARQWGTYIGGTSTEIVYGVTTTCGGDAIVALESQSAGLSTANAYQSAISGSAQDLLLARFSPLGVRQWATYYGGALREFCSDVKLNNKLKIFVCGKAASTSGIATANGYQPVHGGNTYDGFIAQFNEANITGTKTVCQGTTLSLNAEFSTTATPVNYAWSGPGGVTGSSATLSVPNIQLTNAGLYTLTVTINGCPYVKTDSVKVNPAPTAVASVVTPICVGDSVKLTSSGGTGYSWTGPNLFNSTDQNPIIATSVTASNGVYTVTVTGSNGCTSTAATTLVVNGRPASTASSNSPICENATLNLISGPDSQSSYVWSGPLTYASTDQNPSIANSSISVGGTYFVTVTNAFGCTTSAQTVVVVNANPIATASSNSPVCENGTINLNSGPDSQTSYLWSGPLIYTSPAQNPTISSAATGMSGDYSVIVTNSNGCKDTAYVTLTVNPNPVVSAASNSPVCENDTVFLTSLPDGQTSYAWSGPIPFTSGNQNPQIVNSATTQSGPYTVTVTNSFGCTATAQTAVTVNPRPVISASSNSPICEGDTLLLRSTGGTICSWTGEASFTSTDPNPVIVNAAPPMSGLYTVVITNALGCTKSAQTNAIINPKPDITISSSPAICSGYPLNLYASGGADYRWTGPNGYSSLVQNPVIDPVTAADSGLYTVVVTNSFTCKDTADINVVVHDNPIPVLSSNSPICAYDSIQLTSGGGVSYAWAGVHSFASVLQNPVIHTSDSTLSGNYTVTVTNGFGCTTSATTAVEVKSNPKPVLGSNAPICTGDTLKLFTSTGQAYSWNGPQGFVNSLQTPIIANANTGMSGYYTQRVTYVNGCQNNDSIATVVWPNPVLTLSSDTAICLYQPITVSVSGAATYSWNNGNATPSYLVYPTMDTVYRVVGTDTNGCKSTDSMQVMIHPFIQVSITQNPEGTLFKDQVATFTALPASYANYSFYLNNSLIQSTSSNTYTSSSMSDSDTLRVIVSHPNMCFSEPALGIHVIDIYNSFSPNNDGVNDVFLKGYQITVFNRWGDVMYEGVDGWDGKYKGEEVNTGTYYFTIKYYTSENTEINYKGNLMLVR